MTIIIDGTLGISGVDGSAGTPAYAGNDSDTGLWYPASNTLALSTGGTERMRIDSSGNVGIGTSSFVGSERVNITFNSSGATTQALNTRDSNASANGNYHIVLRRSDDTYLGGLRRVGTDNAMGVDGNAYLSLQTTGTERMRIDSSGNVGIGTSSPSAKLDVDAGNPTVINAGGVTVTGQSSGIRFRTGSTKIAWYVGAQNNIDQAFEITPSTANGGTTFSTPAFVINSSGNVGIGTSSPGSILEANRSQDSELQIRLRNTSSGSNARSVLLLGNDANAGTAGIYLNSSANTGTGGGANSLNIYMGLGAPITFLTSAAERMRITSTGQVLVGITGLDGGNRLMSGNGANGWPATSGTTQTNGCLRLRGGDNAVLDFGVNSVNTWIQATDLTALGSLYWLFLNPNGGEVIVAGKTDNGAYNLQCNGTGVWGAGAYVNGSDERIKDNIAPLNSGLDVVTKLNPVTYKYKEDWSKDQSTQTGFIAQELLTALEGKNYVDGIVQQGGENQYMSVAYQNIIPILTKAIQEQQAMIEELKQEVALLKAK